MITSEVLVPLPAASTRCTCAATNRGPRRRAARGRGDRRRRGERSIVRETNERNILLNVVDDLGRSNFHFTAVHRDGDVVVSVSTGGASPALAQWVRNAVARALPRIWRAWHVNFAPSVRRSTLRGRAPRIAGGSRGSTNSRASSARALHDLVDGSDQAAPARTPTGLTRRTVTAGLTA